MRSFDRAAVLQPVKIPAANGGIALLEQSTRLLAAVAEIGSLAA